MKQRKTNRNACAPKKSLQLAIKGSFKSFPACCYLSIRKFLPLLLMWSAKLCFCSLKARLIICFSPLCKHTSTTFHAPYFIRYCFRYNGGIMGAHWAQCGIYMQAEIGGVRLTHGLNMDLSRTWYGVVFNKILLIVLKSRIAIMDWLIHSTKVNNSSHRNWIHRKLKRLILC